MWYVLDCVPGAYLYYGFTHEISKEEFAERIKNNTLTEVLNAVPVHKGGLLFYPVRHAARHLPGHRRGRGAAKLQRDLPLYDYGRVGADASPAPCTLKRRWM